MCSAYIPWASTTSQFLPQLIPIQLQLVGSSPWEIPEQLLSLELMESSLAGVLLGDLIPVVAGGWRGVGLGNRF